MITYLNVYVFVLGLAFFDFFKLIPLRSVLFFCIISLFFVFFIGTRYGGIDYWGYYYVLAENPFHMEKGFGVIAFVSKFLTQSDAGVFLFAAAIAVFTRFSVYKRYSPMFGVSLIVYMTLYFTLDLSQIRNSLAAAFFLASFVFLSKKKMAYYYFLIFISASMHTIGFIGLILPLFSRLRFENVRLRWILFFTAFCLFCFFAFYGGLINRFLEILDGVTFLEQYYIYRKMFGYAGTKHAKEMILLGFGGLRLFLNLLIFTWFFEDAKVYSSIYRSAYVAYFIGVLFWMATSDFGILSYRMMHFWGAGEAILWPCVLKSFAPMKRFLFFMVFSVAMSLLFLKIISNFPNYSNWLFYI